MALSDAGLKDPSMLGQISYQRSPLDFYPTPARATEAFVSKVGDDLEAVQGWEPFCGAGHISKIVGPLCRSFLSTDICAYEGFDPAGLVDFFNIYPDGEAHEKALTEWERQKFFEGVTGEPSPLSMSDIESRFGVRPDAIITNPPYDDKASGVTAEQSLRHALKLMESEKGMVAMLLRHEFDCGKKRRDLFEDHPAFMAKITLRFRPRWIEGTTGSPRHNYAWFLWDWVKALQAPHAAAEQRYAG
jgi:hypothetical protein